MAQNASDIKLHIGGLSIDYWAPEPWLPAENPVRLAKRRLRNGFQDRDTFWSDD